MRYLDPKTDLTFKRVFGEHPDLVISLLNALLPFKNKDEEIVDVEYLSPEMMPQTPTRKYSIVDVRCRDTVGRQFLVEMQMEWTSEFMERVLFNSAKAYVSQLNYGQPFKLLEPVYSLNLINDIFEPDVPEYYHYYRLVHEIHTDKVIDGLHLVFVELPKFKPNNFSDKKMQVLWLRYLTEIENETYSVPKDLFKYPLIKKAVSIIEESAYTEGQLLAIDKFWDIISTQRTLLDSARRKGEAEGFSKGESEGFAKGESEGFAKGEVEGFAKGEVEGFAKGESEGFAKGREEGKAEGKAEGFEDGKFMKSIEIAKNMLLKGMPIEDVCEITGLKREVIEQH